MGCLSVCVFVCARVRVWKINNMLKAFIFEVLSCGYNQDQGLEVKGGGGGLWPTLLCTFWLPISTIKVYFSVFSWHTKIGLVKRQKALIFN